jgi:hypothetical protein
VNSGRDRLPGLVLLVAALVWVWLAYTRIPDTGSEWPGPRGFPLLLGVVLAALGLALAAAPGSRTPDPGSRIGHPDSAIAGATFLMLVLYAFLLDKAGFVISTVGLIAAALALVLRIRRRAFVAAFSVAFALACWVVFDSILGIPLPPGTWLAAFGAR